MDLELRGKRAIVTGGSRGIGKAIARALAAEGVDLALFARGAEALESTAEALAAESGRRVVPIVADTARKDQVDAAVASAIARLDGVDILVNAAALPGGSSAASRIEDFVDEHALHDFDVKAVGYLRTARALAPHLIAKRWGRIINVGGLAAYRTGRTVATLRNIAVSALTKSLADELGPKGINVVAVHPGATRTERTDAEAERRAVQGNLVGRIVDASEVAHVVAFLASPKSIAIQGEAIGTGGGTPGVIHY